jgi:CheY-like chemotaxis protein
MVMILVVDDLPDTCRVLVRLLRISGYQAECVSSGDQALAVMKAIKPQLVVLDEMMPGKSGMDVLKELKAKPELSDVPVLFYSASYDPHKAEEARQAGAVDWLVKGSTQWTELLGKISTLAH